MSEGERMVSRSDDPFRVELSKRLTIVDQGITAHSILRDQFRRWSTTISLFLVFGSAAVTFLAVSADSLKVLLFLSVQVADYLIGIIAFLLLLAAIAELHLGWREKSGRHGEAASALARLKFLIRREVDGSDPIAASRFAELQQAYENTNDLITKIPEAKFLKLKAIHRRKIEISQFLDKSPGSNILVLRIKIWLRDNSKWPSRK